MAIMAAQINFLRLNLNRVCDSKRNPRFVRICLQTDSKETTIMVPYLTIL